MSFAKPLFSKNDVNRAGRILAAPLPVASEIDWATEVLANWRACHLYPINTFQATLRSRIKHIDPYALVAQRLKRAPSVVAKLQRFPTMNLAQMQDIGGLRGVLGNISGVRKLEKAYREAKLFKHQLVSSKDYINQPKPDGYRSVHLVFRYKSEIDAAYDGLHIELQFRTKIQHAWATAVETMGTFLGQALKSGQGDAEWKQFFAISSSALAHLEGTPPVPGLTHLSQADTFGAVAALERELGVLAKLEGFAIAASRISTDPSKGRYHLVVLDTESRSVRITPYSEARLEDANAAYAKVEERTLRGDQIEAVLVSAGPVDALRKAYPNYFLDTHNFVAHLRTVMEQVAPHKPKRSGRSRR